MVEERLLRDGLACERCGDWEALIAALKTDAGAALIAQEAIETSQVASLLDALDAQAPWSDLPILLLTIERSKLAARGAPPLSLLSRANVMLLQRPIPLNLFLSAVRSAVRARLRQYQMRDLYIELSRAVQLSETFAAILGHDLRTPLGAIRMSAELIARSSDGPASRPAERILSSADRMTRMIAQLLDFACIRQGRGIRMHIVRSDLGDIVHSVLLEIGAANPERAVRTPTIGGY
ncbi:MAG: histidine kinase dimerization/phospho-acceptor domain-containing protein [Polyangiaceae bacterium]